MVSHEVLEKALCLAQSVRAAIHGGIRHYNLVEGSVDMRKGAMQ